MSELRAEKEITYKISGLTFKDLELLCLGLDGMDDCEFDMVERKAKLVKVIEDILPSPSKPVD